MNQRGLSSRQSYVSLRSYLLYYRATAAPGKGTQKRGQRRLFSIRR